MAKKRPKKRVAKAKPVLHIGKHDWVAQIKPITKNSRFFYPEDISIREMQYVSAMLGEYKKRVDDTINKAISDFQKQHAEAQGTLEEPVEENKDNIPTSEALIENEIVVTPPTE